MKFYNEDKSCISECYFIQAIYKLLRSRSQIDDKFIEFLDKIIDEGLNIPKYLYSPSILEDFITLYTKYDNPKWRKVIDRIVSQYEEVIQMVKGKDNHKATSNKKSSDYYFFKHYKPFAMIDAIASVATFVASYLMGAGYILGLVRAAIAHAIVSVGYSMSVNYMANSLGKDFAGELPKVFGDILHSLPSVMIPNPCRRSMVDLARNQTSQIQKI